MDKYLYLREYLGECLLEVVPLSDEAVSFVVDLKRGISPVDAKRRIEDLADTLSIYNWPHEDILVRPKRMLGTTNQSTYERLFGSALCLVRYSIPPFRGARTRAEGNCWFAQREAIVPTELGNLVTSVFLNYFPFAERFYFGESENE